MEERTDSLLIARPDGSRRSVTPKSGLTVAQAMFLHQEGPVKPLCGGVGRCGRCAAKFLEGAPEPDPADLATIPQGQLAQGVRLACRHLARPGMVVEEMAGPRSRHPAAPAPGLRAHALAVDLGTTSLHWAALDENGTVLDQGAEANPQLGAGSEIMSRLAFALAGHADFLRELVLARLAALHKGCGSPARLVVAGNPTMTALLLGTKLEGLARAPYRLDEAGGREAKLARDLPPCYLPPQLGPFVGGDVSAGIVAVEAMERPAAPWLLADFGTNGEFALALPDGRLLLTSVPMGPALEGVGLSHGCLAGPGAATGFSLTPAGLTPEVMGPWSETELRGISGTGAISLLAQLRRAGALDGHGRFVTGNPSTSNVALNMASASTSPLALRLLSNVFEERGEPALGLPGKVALRASDAEEVLKVKAACNLAFSRLFAEAGIAAQDVGTLFLAGALGSHARVPDLAELGFIPPRLRDKTRTAGNTSLAGARLLALDPAAREAAAALPGRATILDLTASADYGRHFIERMRFEYVP